MDRQPLDVNNSKFVTRKKRQQGNQGEIEDVLVVNGVELEVFNQVTGIRKLENDSSLRREKRSEGRDESIGVGHVCEHIVSQQQIRRPFGSLQLPGQLKVEECIDRLDPVGARNLRDVPSR